MAILGGVAALYLGDKITGTVMVELCVALDRPKDGEKPCSCLSSGKSRAVKALGLRVLRKIGALWFGD